MSKSTIILVICWLLWAGVHSILASLRVKRWTERMLGQGVTRWYRLVFNAISALTVLPLLLLLISLPDTTY